ncbi:beta-propeller fold lactonase family protein [Thiothrix winogradskyi]|uniref:Beta-propeller fold lactonase family protein n=1 Tax=Thiothrix winogradskyi TaxID=96472 RepID=A0ABY3T2A8_9GAMM|nr:beta-propeller fold lactonase family protein [Thiothrix winogradskyi]UJS25480.1 beta-propeller fold lactonase family protein [Thiothrix winogradskyi]
MKPFTPPFTLALLSFSLLAALPVFAKDTGYLFVSSEKDNNISVLDAKTFEVVKRIGTAARPRHLQFSPDRSKIYAACGDGAAIDIIDVAKLELVDRIAGIEDPELFDISADGKTLYISLEDDGALGILNLDEYFAKRGDKPDLSVAEPAPPGESSESEDDKADHDDDEKEGEGDADTTIPGMKTVEVGEEPEGILLSPDGKTVYVTSEVANTVHVVDTASGEMQANIVVGNRPRRFAMTPDQKELWVTNEISGEVTIIDPATNKVTKTIKFQPKGFREEDVTPVGIAMSSDGKTVIVGLGGANHIAFVDVASQAIQDYVLVGKRAWNVTLNRDNSLLYVANGLSDDISVVDIASRKVVKSVPIARVPHTVLIDD